MADKMYGSYSDADLNDWERFPINANVLTSSAFGAWLLRRDERRDTKTPQEPSLDKIRAEIKEKIEQEEFARSVFRHEEKDAVKAEQCTGSIMAYNNMIKLIDKYKAESEDKDG